MRKKKKRRLRLRLKKRKKPKNKKLRRRRRKRKRGRDLARKSAKERRRRGVRARGSKSQGGTIQHHKAWEAATGSWAKTAGARKDWHGHRTVARMPTSCGQSKTQLQMSGTQVDLRLCKQKASTAERENPAQKVPVRP